MYIIVKKEWTILIYANGNNELEPETSQILSDIENNVVNLDNVNVVLQLSRASLEEIKIMRPKYLLSNEDSHWEQTRRYYYDSDHFELIESLGNVNMGDCNELYNFLIWSTSLFPAKHYLLAFGGHVYQFVGLLADYSQNKPCLASFPQLAHVIEKACEKQKINIDILVLDTCYASTFEIIYEFGKNKREYIKYLLTYTDKAPITGFSYSKIINIIENSSMLSVELLLIKLVEDICKNKGLSLIAFKLSYKLLELYKEIFSNIARTYLLCKPSVREEFEPYDLLCIDDENYPWSVFLSYLAKTIPLSIIKMQENDSERKDLIPIHILYQKLPDEYRKDIYKSLSFSKNNYWFNLIADINISQPIDYPDLTLEPIEIPENILYTMISTSNCFLSDLDIRKIVYDIITLKNWNLQKI